MPAQRASAKPLPRVTAASLELTTSTYCMRTGGTHENRSYSEYRGAGAGPGVVAQSG